MGVDVHKASWTTQDPEAGRAALERAYRHLRMDAPAPLAFRMSLTTLQAGPLGFQQVRLAGHRARAIHDGTGLIRIGHLTHATLQVYPGAPHGITDTHKDQLSTDLLEFITT